MRIYTYSAAILLLASAAVAQDRPAREQLLGSWQVEASDSHETWSLESEGAALRVTRTDEGKLTLDVKCKTDGSDCVSTDEGKKVKITMYFNGSALVQLETKPSQVTSRTFAMGGKADEMTIDVNPLTGAGKQYQLKLTRHLEAAAR